MSNTTAPELSAEGPRALIGYPDLLRTYGLARRSVLELLRRNQFPAQVLIGHGRVARWRRADVDAWVRSLPTKPAKAA